MQLADVYRARIVDVSPSRWSSRPRDEDKIDSFVEVLRPYGVIEMVRTGRVAMARGATPVRPIAARPPTASASDLAVM